MTEPEVALDGGSHSGVVRIGRTVRRAHRRWSEAVQELLRHLEREGFDGAPRALGFDDQGREILTYIDGEVGLDVHATAEAVDRFDCRFRDEVWRDDVLADIGALLRRFHDATGTFEWAGREWCFEPREPAETMCHNEAFPLNTVFRDGRPVAFIDWDTATPGPRAWDLGSVAWRWVPFWRDEKCRAHGLPTGTAVKARRVRVLLDAYGVERDIDIVRAAIERMRGFLELQRSMAAEGSAHELELARRGVLDEQELEIAWVEAHATDLDPR